MKRVSAYELKTFIWERYFYFIKQVPMLESGSIPCSEIKINISPVCIDVYDEGEFDSEDNRKEFMQSFAEHIESMTFGNLKVIDYGCKIDGASYFTWIHIANAYEIEC